uniref:Uncharacterized protein n=1 Tax=viral metagenome TaxID=1070528 RepID=A0A6C0ARZ6_9ZZZZ
MRWYFFNSSYGKFFRPEDSAFLTFPKKSWKKKVKFASTCVGLLFWHFLEKRLNFPTLCRIF